MSHLIQPSEDNAYIIVKITGKIDRTLAMQYNLEAHAIGEKLGISCYLMDLTESRNIDNVVTTYKFAYNDMKHSPGINRSACVSVLVSPDDHSHDFIETVARNSGLDVTLFIDREQAIRHLIGKQAPAG
jgi:hypothetical protein